MLNVHELERRWMRYKIRRYIPVGIAAVSLIGLAAAAVYIWPLFTAPGTDSEDKPVAQTQQPTSPAPAAEPAEKAPAVTAETVPSAAEQPREPVASAAPKNVLSPSMNFIHRLEVSASVHETEKRVFRAAPAPVRETAMTQTTSPAPDERKVTAEKPQIRSEETPAKKPFIAVKTEPKAHRVSITQEEANDLNDVIKRFETNKNPALSLFLARRYYDLEQYSLSYEYALRTNEIDSSIEESWLLFARSLVKLGRKDEALKTLGSYAKHSKSARAKMLLDEIREGKFQ
jgi:hypothetical protein